MPLKKLASIKKKNLLIIKKLSNLLINEIKTHSIKISRSKTIELLTALASSNLFTTQSGNEMMMDFNTLIQTAFTNGIKFQGGDKTPLTNQYSEVLSDTAKLSPLTPTNITTTLLGSSTIIAGFDENASTVEASSIFVGNPTILTVNEAIKSDGKSVATSSGIYAYPLASITGQVSDQFGPSFNDLKNKMSLVRGFNVLPKDGFQEQHNASYPSCASAVKNNHDPNTSDNYPGYYPYTVDTVLGESAKIYPNDTYFDISYWPTIGTIDISKNRACLCSCKRCKKNSK